MASPDIVVVGSCNIDFTFFTNKVPKRGETIYGTKFMNGFGGKGANQCIAAAKLGASTAMIAKLGDDHFGAEYLNVFKKSNVNTSHVSISSGISSGVAQITVSEEEGDNYILIIEGANGLLSIKDVEGATEIIKSAKIGLFQFEIPIKTTIEALKFFKENSKAILMLNPSPSAQNVDPIVFKLSDIVVVNETEAEDLTKQKVENVEDAKKALKVLLDKGCNTAIVTLGSQGAVFSLQSEPEPIHIKVQAIDNPTDPTGAGDLFLGALAYSFIHLSNFKLAEKIQFACNVARECVIKPGAQESFPSMTDILHIINSK